jgi:hypothetical protein
MNLFTSERGFKFIVFGDKILTCLVLMMNVQENIREIMTEAITYFSNEISKYSPCLYRLRNGTLCGIARDWHTTGHYGEREVGPHLGPPLPSQNILFHKLKQNLEKLVSMVLLSFHSLFQLPVCWMILFPTFCSKIFLCSEHLSTRADDLFFFHKPSSIESNGQNTKSNRIASSWLGTQIIKRTLGTRESLDSVLSDLLEKFYKRTNCESSQMQSCDL